MHILDYNYGELISNLKKLSNAIECITEDNNIEYWRNKKDEIEKITLRISSLHRDVETYLEFNSHLLSKHYEEIEEII